MAELSINPMALGTWADKPFFGLAGTKRLGNEEISRETFPKPVLLQVFIGHLVHALQHNSLLVASRFLKNQIDLLAAFPVLFFLLQLLGQLCERDAVDGVLFVDDDGHIQTVRKNCW